MKKKCNTRITYRFTNRFTYLSRLVRVSEMICICETLYFPSIIHPYKIYYKLWAFVLRVRDNTFISDAQPRVFDFMQPHSVCVHKIRVYQRLCRCIYIHVSCLASSDIGGGGKGAEERVGTSRAGTINTCHASHTYTRAHLSFHTRADPRGAHACDRVCRVGNAHAERLDSPYI